MSPERQPQFRQWRPPSEERLMNEFDRREVRFDDLVDGLKRRRNDIEKLGFFTHAGEFGGITLELGNNFIPEASTAATEDGLDARQSPTSSQSSKLSFQFYNREDYDVLEHEGENNPDNDMSIYALSTHFSIPTSFISVPADTQEDLAEMLEYRDIVSETDTPEERMLKLLELDDADSSLRINQLTDVSYTVDPIFRNITCEYTISYELFDEGILVETLEGTTYDSSFGGAGLDPVHGTNDELSPEYVILNAYQDEEDLVSIAEDPESLEAAADNIITGIRFDKITKQEFLNGTGMTSGLSDTQLLRLLDHMLGYLTK